MSATPPAPPTRIGLTVGDPAGIGPEVVSAALAALAESGGSTTETPTKSGGSTRFVVYGDVAAVERVAPLPEGVGSRVFCSAQVAPGKPDPAAASGVIEAIRAAAGDCMAGKIDALVTGPISKEVIGQAGFEYPGHTELLQELGGAHAVMLLAGGKLRVGLATIHCALREVPERLSSQGIAATLDVMDRDLRARFALEAPRIAVCGLNPHAGEGGRFGDEEARLIAPAIERAVQAGVRASGPFAADSLFHRAIAGEFDAVLAMYHDQGLGPLKTHAFGLAVNVTLGLPFIRTSVDHGTAFDIAGRGRADPESMIEAVRLAVELSSNERAGGEQSA